MGSRYIYRFSRTILIAIFLIGSTLLPILTYSPVSASTSTTDKKLTYKYDKLFNVGNPSGYSRVNSVITDSSGNVYITGYISGQVTLPGANGFSVNLPVKNTNPNSMPSPMSMHQPTPFGPNSSFGPKNQIKPNADSLNGTMFIAKLDTNNNILWSKVASSNNSSAGNSVATDSSGNIYISGIFYGTTVFSPGNLSSSVSSNNSDSFLVKYNSSGVYQSVKTFDTSGGYANTTSMAVDSSDNVYFSGQFSGTVVFSPSHPGSSVTNNNGDSFLVKYNSSGVYQSVNTFDTSGGNANTTSMAVDSSGNVFVAGQFNSTVIFNPGYPISSVTSNNGDGFMVKYNSSGVYQSVKTFDTSNGGYAGTNSMAVDSSGNVFVAGIFYGTTIFSPGDPGSSVTGNSGDSFLVKYNSSGVYQSVKTIHNTSNGDMGIDSIAFDSSGNIFAAGFLSGTAIFSPGDPGSSVTTSNYASYLVKYNKDGSYAWVKTFGLGETGSNSGNNTIAIDSNNDIYLGGSYTGTIYFDGPGGNIATPNTVLGTNNVYLAKLDPNGKYLTSSVFDSSDPAGANSGIYGIALHNNEVSVVGEFSGAVQFNPGDSSTKAVFTEGNGFMVTYDLTSTLLPINTPNTGFAKEVSNKLSITEDILIIGSVITLCLVARKYKAYK